MFVTIEFGRFDIKFVRMISSRTLSFGEFEKVFKFQMIKTKNNLSDLSCFYMFIPHLFKVQNTYMFMD